MNRGWLRYGLVGNLIFFGGSFAFIAYTSTFSYIIAWIIYDIG